MNTVQEINRAIITGSFTPDELMSIVDAVTFARNQLTRRNTGLLVLGTQVKFTNSRTRQVVQGRVEKVGRKLIVVNTGVMRWRVPAHMLERA